MDKLIQWPSAKYWDKAWNPIIGCKPCSPACEHCYAAAWAKRFGQSFEPHETKQRPPRKGVVFCGNITDLFGEWECSPERFLVDTVRKQNETVATFLWLTKRVSRMCDAVCAMSLCADWRVRLNANHYFGFTAENQEWFEKRIEKCIDHPYGINMWLSLEPLLGPIELYPIIRDGSTWPFKWVVVGCESGPKRRPCKIEWVESIVEQCMAANVPVFVKQISIGGRCVTDINRFPAHLRIRQVPWAK